MKNRWKMSELRLLLLTAMLVSPVSGRAVAESPVFGLVCEEASAREPLAVTQFLQIINKKVLIGADEARERLLQEEAPARLAKMSLVQLHELSLRLEEKERKLFSLRDEALDAQVLRVYFERMLSEEDSFFLREWLHRVENSGLISSWFFQQGLLKSSDFESELDTLLEQARQQHDSLGVNESLFAERLSATSQMLVQRELELHPVRDFTSPRVNSLEEAIQLMNLEPLVAAATPGGSGALSNRELKPQPESSWRPVISFEKETNVLTAQVTELRYTSYSAPEKLSALWQKAARLSPDVIRIPDWLGQGYMVCYEKGLDHNFLTYKFGFFANQQEAYAFVNQIREAKVKARSL